MHTDEKYLNCEDIFEKQLWMNLFCAFKSKHF